MSLTPLEYFLKWERETPENAFLRQPVNDQWNVYSYQKAGDEIRRMAAYLQQLNFPPKTNIAILSKNCAHWIMADLAIMMAGHIGVPIYPTLSAKGVAQIMDHSEAKVIFLGKLDDYPSQKPGISEQVHKISFPYLPQSEGINWNDVISKYDPIQNPTPPSKDDIATIMYSSGTTGTPKGVMLSHGAFGYVGHRVATQLKITKPERLFSYLPLSHIAEKGLMQMVAIASGSTISFTESLEKFADNLRHEKPTIFGGVPRIYAKFQEGILKKLPEQKLQRLLSIPIISSIVKKSIAKKLGLNEARVIVSGAAPTPVTLLKWFAKLGVDIREMYGMTENTALSHSNYERNKIGTVGQPWNEVEAKISEEGEVLIRHKALMKGYFKDEETTKMVFTKDGFLKTGDQGSIDADGFLTITGRMKDQFKTDKAKFIAPAPIELKLLSNTLIEQVCVVGMGIPQPIALTVLSAEGKLKSKEEISRILSAFVQEVNKTLENYEVLEKVVIMQEPWTVENGLMTPSLKVKRNELEKIYLALYPEWYKKPGMVVWQ